MSSGWSAVRGWRAAFLEAHLVDELILYVAPRLLGADAAPLTALRGLSSEGPAAEL